MSDRLRRCARCAPLVLLLALPSCAYFEGRAQYRSRARDADRAAVAAAASAAAALPFAASATLDRGALVDAVLRRNPTIAAARHAWRAALARHPQETALEDPMLAGMLGPRSIDSPQIRRAYRVEARQAFPFPGKLSLRGAVALAEAAASESDLAAVRLRLASMASSLYDDYWLAERALEINAQHLDLVRELRASATARYESGMAELQDPLQAELEEAELLHEQVELGAARRVATAQLARLLHVADDAALPPPPAELAAVEVPGGASAALERALSERPELRAASARVDARRAAERLALREFLPDFALSGGIDTFWEMRDQQPFVGLELNLPLQIGKRRAALAQARAELDEARSEEQELHDEITAEVRAATANWEAAVHGHQIASERMLPAARDRLAAARAAFEAGRVEFGDVIESERRLRSAELGERTALAEASRRAADLLAALGVAPGATESAVETPQAHAPSHEEGARHE